MQPIAWSQSRAIARAASTAVLVHRLACDSSANARRGICAALLTDASQQARRASCDARRTRVLSRDRHWHALAHGSPRRAVALCAPIPRRRLRWPRGSARRRCTRRHPGATRRRMRLPQQRAAAISSAPRNPRRGHIQCAAESARRPCSDRCVIHVTSDSTGASVCSATRLFMPTRALIANALCTSSAYAHQHGAAGVRAELNTELRTPSLHVMDKTRPRATASTHARRDPSRTSARPRTCAAITAAEAAAAHARALLAERMSLWGGPVDWDAILELLSGPHAKRVAAVRVRPPKNAERAARKTRRKLAARHMLDEEHHDLSHACTFCSCVHHLCSCTCSHCAHGDSHPHEHHSDTQCPGPSGQCEERPDAHSLTTAKQGHVTGTGVDSTSASHPASQATTTTAAATTTTTPTAHGAMGTSQLSSTSASASGCGHMLLPASGAQSTAPAESERRHGPVSSTATTATASRYAASEACTSSAASSPCMLCMASVRSCADDFTEYKAPSNKAPTVFAPVSLLHMACVDRRLDIIRALLRTGVVSPDGPSDTQDSVLTPLFLAVRKDYADVVDLLLKAGADPHIAPTTLRKADFTLLHWACGSCASRRILSTLIEVGRFDINQRTTKAKWTPLHCAVNVESFAAVRELLRAGADPGARNRLRATPVHLSVRCKTTRIMNALVEAGADPNAMDIEGEAPIHYASTLNLAEPLIRLLELGVDPICRTRKDGATPLQIAARLGADSCVNVLVSLREEESQGKSEKERKRIIRNRVNMLDNNTEPALNQACFNGCLATVKKLLECGADPELPSKENWAAIHFAAGYGDHHVVRTLIKHGVDACKADKMGTTALHALTNPPKYTASLSSRLRSIRMLVKAQLPLDALTRNKIWSPLLFSVAGGEIEIVEELLRLGANPLIVNKHGNNMLHVAALFGHWTCLELGVSVGVGVETRNRGGFTPMHLAAQFRYEPCILVLLESGGDVNAASSKKGQSPLMIAVQPSDVIKGDTQDLRLRTMELLIRHGARLEQKNRLGQTVLGVAAKNGEVLIIERLIRVHRARIDATDPATSTKTPLYWAAKFGRTQAVDLLLRHGANPDVVAFRAAVLGNHVDVVQRLLAAHAPLASTFNNKNRLPIHDAASTGAKDVANILLTVHPEVNPTTKDEARETPLTIAAASRQRRFVRFCIERGVDDIPPRCIRYALRNKDHKLVAELLQAGCQPPVGPETPQDEHTWTCAKRLINQDRKEQKKSTDANIVDGLEREPLPGTKQNPYAGWRIRREKKGERVNPGDEPSNVKGGFLDIRLEIDGSISHGCLLIGYLWEE